MSREWFMAVESRRREYLMLAICIFLHIVVLYLAWQASLLTPRIIHFVDDCNAVTGILT